MHLNGKVAVVTGAGRGLGRAYATALARAGAKVVVNDLEGADTAPGEIGGAAHTGAIGSSEVADELVQLAVSTYGRLDVMVTNAGILRDKVLWKMTDEDFDLVIATHLKGTFTCARAAAIQMREQGDGGRIIVVGSPAGQYGNFGQTNYAAAKAGIVAFARTWAMELARAQVTGQAIGIGGDRLSLYSHPTEIAHEFCDGGWTADAIAEAWSTFPVTPVGVKLPELDLP